MPLWKKLNDANSAPKFIADAANGETGKQEFAKGEVVRVYGNEGYSVPPGWARKIVGTGNRSGRIIWESLVALKYSASTPIETIFARIAEINKTYTNKTPVVPQAYNDYVAEDAIDPNMHPHMGTFTHTAVKSGRWSDPTLWNTGTVPGANAVVNTSTFDVMYDLESDVLIKDIHVSGAGTFSIDPAKDTRLWVDTLMVHGTFIAGTKSNPIGNSATNGKPRCEIVFWQSEAPLTTTRLGLMTMGPVRIYGAKKSEKLYCNVDMPAGATSVTLNDVANSGWRVGDTIVFGGTEDAGMSPTDAQYTGPMSAYLPIRGVSTVQNVSGFKLSKDEVRTITAISGDTVTFNTALVYPHKLYSAQLKRGQTVTLKPFVSNLSRSIRFRSADASDTVWVGDLTNLQKRAHTMFMFSDDIQARYAEAKNMARTDTNPTLVAPSFGQGPTEAVVRATSGGTILTDPNNVRGRYAWHIHGTGAFFGRKQVALEGLTAWAPPTAPPMPGWAITHHNARASIEKCVVYNARGAGIVSEKGNEIGQWLDNVVMWCRGDGLEVSWGSRQEVLENHNGSAGVAYENQARQILQHNNIATSSRYGWLFVQQNANMLVRVPDKGALRLYDPITQGGRQGVSNGEYGQDSSTYGIEQAQIPDFDNNICYSSEVGFAVAHRQFTDREDSTPMVSKGFHNIRVGMPFHLINYSFYYSFYDALWVGISSTSSVGSSLGPVSWQFVFANIHLRDFNTGFSDAGLILNYNGDWIDLTFENVTTPFRASEVAISNADDNPANNPAYGMYGPFQIVNNDVPNPGYTVIPRQWVNRDSADPNPPYPAAPWGYGGVEPLPGTPKPYFYLDPASDTTLVAGNVVGQISINGAIVDNLGVRKYPDWQSSESFPANLHLGIPRTGHFTTGEDLIIRNGIFNDNGTYKCRLWFTDHDRKLGNYFQWYVDLTCTGFTTNFINANLITDPNSTKPVVPLKPEIISDTEIVRDTSTPVIVSSPTTQIVSGQPLLYRFRANKGQGKWTLSGPDAAKFEINGGFYLRFAGNAVKNSAAPDDANADGIYQFSVTFTDQFGNASAPQAMTVSLQNFVDDFSGDAGLELDNRYGWSYVSGQSLANKLDGNGGLARPVTGAPSYVRAFPLTSYNQAVDIDYIGSVGKCEVILRFTDASNYISVARNDSTPNNVVVRQVKAGTITQLATYTQVSSGMTASRFTFEVTGNTFAWKRDGVVQTPLTGSTTMTDLIPDSYGVGIKGVAGGGTGVWLSRVEYRNLA